MSSLWSCQKQSCCPSSARSSALNIFIGSKWIEKAGAEVGDDGFWGFFSAPGTAFD